MGNLNAKSTLLASIFGGHSKVSGRMNGFEINKEKQAEKFIAAVDVIIKVCELNNDQKDEIWYVLLDNIINIRDNVLKNNTA